MFNKKFDKLVREKPHLFEYDFDQPEGRYSDASQAHLDEQAKTLKDRRAASLENAASKAAIIQTEFDF
jgi:hypothetical protein